MKLKIGYFYYDLLNLYGDNGNVEILANRAKQKGADVEVYRISIGDKIPEDLNLVFMGGGPDLGQKQMFEDLKTHKYSFLKHYIESDGAGLFICGSYQLLGHYYKASDGSVLEGLGIFDLHTEHFGELKPRCIGNTVAQLSDRITHDYRFVSLAGFSNEIVGFENHGGRTYLGKKVQPFAKVITGHGNNSEDGSEGVLYKNSIGTYFHGPILSRNAHLADFLIHKALNLSQEQIKTLPQIDDSLVLSAYTASKKLKQ